VSESISTDANSLSFVSNPPNTNIRSATQRYGGRMIASTFVRGHAMEIARRVEWRRRRRPCVGRRQVDVACGRHDELVILATAHERLHTFESFNYLRPSMRIT
jgi:hypothetical protein